MENKIEIAKIVLAVHGRITNLSGPANAKARQRLIELITGKKTPIAKAGVNNAQCIALDYIKAPAGCLAEQYDYAKEWAINILK